MKLIDNKDLTKGGLYFMANIVMCRVDERGIHGQVAASWTNTLNASRIMVVDDMAAKDDIQKMALKMACPSSAKLSILPVEKAVARLNDPANYVGERLFVIFKNTDNLRRAIDAGAPITKVTIGNISNKVGSQLLFKSVTVSKQDKENILYIASKGVEVTGQQVPADPKEDVVKLLEKINF